MENKPTYQTGNTTQLTGNEKCFLEFDDGWEAPSKEQIRAFLSQFGLSGSAVGNLVGVKSRQVRRWTSGDSEIPYSAWMLLAEKVGFFKNEYASLHVRDLWTRYNNGCDADQIREDLRVRVGSFIKKKPLLLEWDSKCVESIIPAIYENKNRTENHTDGRSLLIALKAADDLNERMHKISLDLLKPAPKEKVNGYLSDLAALE